MTEEIVRAMDKRLKLRLASLCESQKKNPYTAIFIWDPDDNRELIDTNSVTRSMEERLPNDFAFTASDLREEAMPDVDRHVSLQVHCLDALGQAGDSVPRLYVRCWLFGLCFFTGRRRREVIFPWPTTLESINA
jgi:hypothetical protein